MMENRDHQLDWQPVESGIVVAQLSPFETGLHKSLGCVDDGDGVHVCV
jgi:hypothetical protein